MVALLQAHGADAGNAEKIVRTLDAAGLTPAQSKAWLSHPQKAYQVRPFEIEVAGRPMRPPVMPVEAVGGDGVDTVIAAAKEFAAASPEERHISLTFLCSIEQVRRLTHQRARRTAQLLDVAQLLRNKLGKETVIDEVLKTLLAPRQTEWSGTPQPQTRLVDCLADERLPVVLEDLREGRIDVVDLHRHGDVDYYGW